MDTDNAGKGNDWRSTAGEMVISRKTRTCQTLKDSRRTPVTCRSGRPEVGAALPEEGGRRELHQPEPPPPLLPLPPPPLPLPTSLSACPDKPRTLALILGPIFARTFPEWPKPCCPGRRRRTCPHLSLAKDTSPQFPPSSPPPSGNRSHLNPFPSPGVPFPERGFEQRRDVRPLDVQIRRSAFRHLLPLAVAEAAATAARPRALWEWRPAAPPSRQVETNRDVGGWCDSVQGNPGSELSVLFWSAARFPRSGAPLVQLFALAPSLPGPPSFSSRWGPLSSLV